MTLQTIQLEIPCDNCGQGVVVELTEPRIVNTPENCVIVTTHDKTVDCPHCRQTLGIILGAVQGYMFRTVKVQRQPSSLIVPNGFRA